MATKDEIERLKANWDNDPCWDIEGTPGFEEHYEELKAHSIKMIEIWDRQHAVRSCLLKKAEELGVPGNTTLAEYIINLESRIVSLERLCLSQQEKEGNNELDSD